MLDQVAILPKHKLEAAYASGDFAKAWSAATPPSELTYASDTPYTQARTLGARGLSYYGMDSTYASSLAILRRILRLEGALD